LEPAISVYFDHLKISSFLHQKSKHAEMIKILRVSVKP